MATHREKHDGGTTAVAEPQDRNRFSEEGGQSKERGGAISTRPASAGLPALLYGGAPGSPWEMMRRMSEEIDRLLGSLGTGLTTGRPGTTPTRGFTGPPMLLPQIEVIQRQGALVVRADLPGLKSEDINVRVDDGMLTISGERRQEQKQEREGFVQSEVTYGTFYRTIPLPSGADENRISATFRNGVLEVTVPLSERERGRQVKVQS